MIPNTQTQYQVYQDAQAKARKQQLGGTSFLAALQQALAGADQQNTALRRTQQQLTEQSFSEPTKYREELIASGISDPYRRQALLDQRKGQTAGNLAGVEGKLADLGGQRSDVLKTAGGAYDAETLAAQQEAQDAGSFFKQLLGNDQSREQMLAQQGFTSKQSELDRAFQARESALQRANVNANRAAPASPWNVITNPATGELIWVNEKTQETKPFTGPAPSPAPPQGIPGVFGPPVPPGMVDNSPVANWARQVSSGQVKLSDVPAAMKTGVNNYLSQNKLSINKPLTAAAKTSMDALSSAETIVNQIDTLATKINRYGGLSRLPAKGALKGGAMSQLNTDAALLESKIGFISNLARSIGGEKGVLTDYDIDRIKKALPVLGDSPQLTKAKLKELREIIKEKKTTITNKSNEGTSVIDALTAGGFDMSSFETP